MGRSSERAGQQLRLDIKPPAVFRCPISLEVMRSPVSLCTGVTYDRSSIQRWLDSGNTTCPATMLPLPTTDLIPNLTLRRLINLWSSSSSSSSTRGKDDYAPADLVKDLTSPSSDPFPILDRLLHLFADPDVDDSIKNGVVSIPDFANAVVSLILNRDRNGALKSTVEAAIEVVSTILNSDWIQEKNKEAVLCKLCADLDTTITSLAEVLKEGRKLDSITTAARVVQALLSDRSESLSPERVDTLVAIIIELIENSSAVDEGLGCLTELLHSKEAVKTMVQFGVVLALVRILSATSLQVSSESAERAILILEAVVNCSTGRAAIGETVEDCVRAVMERMMKVGKGGREAAVGVLWGVCCGACGGGVRRRAREAVVAVRGGMAKILVVMQGDCSPAVRRMAGELLRLFRVDAKSLVAGYDTHTTHIMPF